MNEQKAVTHILKERRRLTSHLTEGHLLGEGDLREMYWPELERYHENLHEVASWVHNHYLDGFGNRTY